VTKRYSLQGPTAWKMFPYSKRISDAKKVEIKKQEIECSAKSKSSQRTELTTFIAKLKSRQEEVPLMESYIDRAKCEPLHLKNNTTKELFLKVMRIALSEAKLYNVKKHSDINDDNLWNRFLLFVKSQMGCNFLVKKIIQWFNENSGKVDKDFTFRFRGKESLAYIQRFPKLINSVLLENISAESKIKLTQIFYMSLCHRKIMSYMVRIEEFDDSMLKELTKECEKLFVAACLYNKSVSPSLWTVCNVVPSHAKVTFNEYGMGLGSNTMEGREQKHQRIEKYAHNTTYQCRWPLIFRHEYVQLVYLRENGYDVLNYRKGKKNYIPMQNQGECTDCGLIAVDDKCLICLSNAMLNIKLEVSMKLL